MAGQVNIVLRAVDEYSSAITGLNQGFELVGKALNAVKFAADIAFGAIQRGIDFGSTIIELGRLGGAFQEQRNQFENLANSYDLVGQDIIDIVKRTSANTLTEFDSIAVATRGLAAGFRGEEFETALAYIKRWTEATGESFESAAERVFTSLSSGRFSVLRQMGLIVENGATLEQVTNAMAESLENFGETGFNAADKLQAISASTDDFTRKIGQAINDSDFFREVLGGVSDAVVALVNGFDQAPITEFINNAYQEFLFLASNIRFLIPNALEDWRRAFNSIEDDSIDSIGSIRFALVALAQTWNDLIDSIPEGGILGTAFDAALVSATELYSLLIGAASLVGEAVRSILAFGEAVNILFGQMQAGFSLIISGIAGSAGFIVDSFLELFDEIEDQIDRRNLNFFERAFLRSVPVDQIRSVSNFLGSLVETTLDDAITRSGQTGTEQISSLGSAVSSVQQLFAARSSALRDSLKFDADSYRRSVEGMTGSTEAAATASANAIRSTASTALNNITSLAQNTKQAVSFAIEGVGQITSGIVLPDFVSLQQQAQDFARETREAIFGGGTEAQQPAWRDSMEQQPTQNRAEELLARADWPTEFRAIGEFLFDIVLSIAEESPLPYAITTRGAGL